ncbi:MAG: DEAD/DEAH box helicase [Bacilli bacterium]|nr:DEAD/DEAH box helicase [Bacilli bacterium]
MENIQLFKHQQAALDDTRKFNKVAYYLDMGLGKTFVGSEKLKSFRTNLNLLICQKSKVNDWMEHYRTYYPYDISAYDLTNKQGLKDFIENPLDYRFRVGIINYELTFRRKESLQLKHLTLMLDESSMIQNEIAKRSKFILKMKPDNVILLSGTPTAGKYENLWSQLRLLGWNISKELYWKQYIETEWVEEDSGFFRKDVIGYKNVDRLKMKLRQHGAIFMKSEEVVDLPEQIFNKVMIGTTKEYRKFMKNRIITIQDKELVGDHALTKRLYARMLCGHYNPKKLDAFKDLIDSTEDRLVVFYNFSDELTAMLALVEDKPVSIINGSTKDLEAYNEHDNSITFVQYQAGSMGLNLQKANKVIYFTLPQSSELFEQSKKRVHRIGQNKRCFYYLMMCRGSVEEDILQNLEMRKDYTDELFKAYDEG